MPDLAKVLKSEITRISKRANSSDVTSLKKEVTSLKRQVSHLSKTTELLEKHVAKLLLSV